MADQLFPAKFSPEKEIALKTYLKRRVLSLKQGMRELFEQKIVRWRDCYNAKPLEEIRQFPFQNASNLIIPLVAIHSDTLNAQLMAAIFKTSPLVVAQVMGEQNTEADELKEAYQEYMNYVGLEPQELDLYRVYGEGMPECIKYGTVTYKCPWDKVVRDFRIPGGDGTGSAKDFEPRTMYEGPRPEKLPFTSFYIPPMAKSIEDADFKAHKLVLLEHQLKERKFGDVYDKKAVDTVLESPDRTSPTNEQQEKEDTLGVHTSASFGHKEWDVWECYVAYRADDEAFAPRMIVTYHEKSDTILRVMYDNMEFEWFVGARMGKIDDMYHGCGFAESLWYFQEGASETYNGYRDNQTVANTRVWRVDPDSKLHQGYRIYPSAMLPANKDEIEALAHGDLSQINIDELRLLLDLAERRSGVSPPMQGMGAGTQTKRGVYSAMGTLALLQEGNSRKDLNVSDMRDSHVRLMRLCSHLYGVMGQGSKFHERRLGLFGTKAEKIQEALSKIVNKQMALPCYSSTASVNREVEKQNDMMLSQVLMRHYQSVAQLLQASQNSMQSPVLREFYVEIIVAANLMMKKMMRHFGYDEVERLIPDPVKKLLAQAQQQGGQQANAQSNTQGGPNSPNVATASSGPQQQHPVMAGQPTTPIQ